MTLDKHAANLLRYLAKRGAPLNLLAVLPWHRELEAAGLITIGPHGHNRIKIAPTQAGLDALAAYSFDARRERAGSRDVP